MAGQRNRREGRNSAELNLVMYHAERYKQDLAYAERVLRSFTWLALTEDDAN